MMRRLVYLAFAANTYELAALTTHRVPTITQLVHRHRHPATAIPIAVTIPALAAYLLWHLLIDEPNP